MRKPKLFIGSSVEGLNVAYAVQDNLMHTSECTVWDQGVFNLSESSLESLIKALNSSDFGVFIFTPDDYIKIRGESNLAVRDNVLFELGLFVGRLGRERSFIIVPDNKNFHLPTDLIGISPAKYEAARNDGNIQAGTGSAANLIRNAINRLGLFDKSESNNTEDAKGEIIENDISESWIEDYFIKKDYDSAIKKLTIQIETEKDNIKKLNAYGYLCDIEYTKNPQIGNEKFKDFISANPTDTIAYQQFANTLAKNNLISKALDIVENGIDKCSHKIKLSIMKANYLSLLDRDDDAIKFLNEQKSILNSPEVYSQLAKLLNKTGHKKEALIEFLSGYKLDPKNENLISEFAIACFDSEYKDVSILLYNDLTKIHEDNPTYWTLLGNSYLNADLYNSALKAYEKGNEIAKGKQGWILANIGNLYNNKKLFNKAEKYLTESIEIDGKSDYTLDRLAGVYKNLKEEDEKIDRIRKEAKIILNNEFQKKEINYEE